MQWAEFDPTEWVHRSTTLHRHEPCGEAIEGFDGLSVFSCGNARLEIFWVAERDGHGPFDLTLTSDVVLSPDETRDGQLDGAVVLGSSIPNWQDQAYRALQKLSGTQFDLFGRKHEAK